MLRPSLAKLQKCAFAPVDIASLVFFRIAFGVLMVWEIARTFAYHWIGNSWLEPRFLFKYYGFSWIHPWPGNGIYIHWAAVGLFALFVAAGFLYRVSAVLFFLSYTYFFLLDAARYVNHEYLVCLFAFLLIFVPGNRAFSVDAWLCPKLRSPITPAWSLWILRAQIGVVYFIAGVAKISPDWLRAEPMRTRMAHNADLPIIGRFFREAWAAYAVSYGGLFLDLFAVPLLLWRRTRLLAFWLLVTFHLINWQAFALGFFPWLAICATTLFLSPSWPRRIVAMVRPQPRPASQDWKLPSSSGKQLAILILGAIYVVIQLAIPLRYLLDPCGVEWISVDHRFSWRMMLVNRKARSYFYVTDPNNGRTRQIRPEQFLNRRQTAMIGYHPDLALQFAHYLARIIPRTGPKPLRVEARILVSVNGRKPELFLDPNVDLANEKRSLGRPHWLLPIHEPLPSRPNELSKEDLAPQLDGH